MILLIFLNNWYSLEDVPTNTTRLDWLESKYNINKHIFTTIKQSNLTIREFIDNKLNEEKEN